MRVHVVSDVHGRFDALPAAGAGADAVVCLGDLVCFLDYDDRAGGISAQLFGPQATAHLIELRTARRFEEAREFSRALWGRFDDPAAVHDEAVRRQYAQLAAALPTPAYLTVGNVDLPHLLAPLLGVRQHLLDGATVTIGGRTFGFVGGGLRTPYHTPNELTDEAFAAKVAAVGSVDVLCCHIPPDEPDLLYDVRARRAERGSVALADAIRDTQPQLVLFGHVHNPLAVRRRIGRTECVNVGHFRATGRPYALAW